MKYITLIIGLLVVGCGKQEQTDTNESTNTNEVDGATAKPVKELTLEEKKVIGTYEMEAGEDTFRAVYLDNGIVEHYTNGKKQEGEDTWKIVDGELHIIHETGIAVFRINKDGSKTGIAVIEDGKREEFTKETQYTIKKIK